MTVEIINCEQNSPEWFEARRGLPTASNFAAILAKGEGKMRRTYMLKLAGEVITGELAESFSNEHTERGHAMEDEARDLYAFETGAELQRVGFVRNTGIIPGRVIGCSPDSLMGDDGGLEIKTKLPHLLIDVILKDKFPAEHYAQVQGTLWVTGRTWWDLVVYYRGIPQFRKRAYRDEKYIDTLAATVREFTDELDATVKQIKAHSGASTLGADLNASVEAFA